MAIRDVSDSLGDDDVVHVDSLDPDGNNDVHIVLTAGRAKVSIRAGGGELFVKTERRKVVEYEGETEEDIISEVQVISQINEA
jgi:hypothetical protein